MDRGVVTIDDTESHRELLCEAAEHAESADAELLLLRFLDEKTYEQEIETLETIGNIENVNYTADEVTEAVTANTRELAEVVLEEFDVDFNVAVSVTSDKRRADRLIETGAAHDCDHAFIVGESRSPTGKALFGDFAQNVILNFGGYVTVTFDKRQ
ncbi:universal stress family protein [Halogeometricum borinquense DSM 11551]|uniref:Universal stress family protein n=1 Tax=Halogeometricum borinquense (strain ATCC 700274 / DSM 11551 / JCM 10706 / KCTC 4070 / PR3) TaxID=469382 RepID=E4NWN9_HALBP|nr:universal stress protein [Halogeometricum borinquense]ADQ69459.1 universal stress family protein [Halogeometricum borinquense DSM 11551]ELY25767.1 universal stress family protein [Halogeometricum borinquense DSM 11551]